MTLWTPEELIAATDGTFTSQPNSPTMGVSIDTRSLQLGDLFIAIVGQNFDGHDFVEAAFKSGASCAIVDRIIPAAKFGSCLLVSNTEKAMRNLAVFARDRAKNAVRIAITGSVGKTSVKELLFSGFSKIGKTHRSPSSYNNHWGVPLSLAKMPRDCEYGIFEIGTNSPGEIAPLSKLVSPHIAHITTIAPAHLAGFDSFEALAKEKASIFDGLINAGIGIIHRDQPHYALAFEVARTKNATRIISFGQHRSANVRLISYKQPCDDNRKEKLKYINNNGVTVESKPGMIDMCFDVYGARIPVYTKVLGRHNAVNIAGVLACGFARDVDMQKFIEGIAQADSVHRRSQEINLNVEDGSATLINDSHNANPASMDAAISLLAEHANGRRTIAVLGDMLELGINSDSWHASLAEHLKRNHIDLVFAVGPLMKYMWEVVPQGMRAVYSNDIDQIITSLVATINKGDVILVKGSHASEAYRIADAIEKHFSIESNNNSVSPNIYSLRG